MARSLEEVTVLYQAHCEKIRTVVLGTVDSQGCPLASYAPFVIDPDKNIYIMVSGMSPHTKNLESTGLASAMFIEDESRSTEIFARHRLTYQCSVSIIDSTNEDFDRVADHMYERHGTVVEHMRLLPDFRILCLSPKSGRFIIGFGAAYVTSGDNLNELKHLGGSGGNPHGHAHGSPHARDNPHGVRPRSAGSARLTAMGHGRDESSSSRLPATPSGALNESMCKMIVKHMNEHHAESLVNIVKAFGNIHALEQAHMLSLNSSGMNISIGAGESQSDIFISFDQTLDDARDAQGTLVRMSTEAKKRLSTS